MSKEYVIYHGDRFAIEWYFSATGGSPPLDYFNGMSTSSQRRFLYLIKRMGDFGVIRDKSKFMYEGKGVYAFKPQPHRFLSFFSCEKKIIVTHAFIKKSQRLPGKERATSMARKKDFENRVRVGTYYE